MTKISIRDFAAYNSSTTKDFARAKGVSQTTARKYAARIGMKKSHAHLSGVRRMAALKRWGLLAPCVVSDEGKVHALRKSVSAKIQKKPRQELFHVKSLCGKKIVVDGKIKEDVPDCLRCKAILRRANGRR